MYDNALDMEKVDKIADILCDLDEYEVIDIHNELNEYFGDATGRIYYMNDFNDVVMGEGYTPMEILEKTESNFEPWQDYFWIDYDGEIWSFDDIYERVDTYEMANFIIECEDDFGNSEICDVLHGEES